MGVGIGDITSDSRLSLLITHIRYETNAVYMPIGNGLFADKSAVAGMAAIDLPYTGWGCGLVDFDNDGNLDVAVVNGRVGAGRWIRGPGWASSGTPTRSRTCYSGAMARGISRI